MVSASSYEVCACQTQWGLSNPIGSALPILESMGAQCVPNLPSSLPICQVMDFQATEQDTELTCDCEKWLAENSEEPLPSNNPCAGYVVESSTVSAECHQT